jgi:hypothetical protein
MKLNIVPARTGLTWVRLGIKTFWQQPLAMSGLFFMFMTMILVATVVPFIGTALALALLPAATLGLMAATEEATKGNFPMPVLLISAFRAGQQRMRAMLMLGAFNALGFFCVVGLSALVDGGLFASLLLGNPITEEQMQQDSFQATLWVVRLLSLPISLLLWHAPALVHWHGVPPLKSVFFSFMACYKNFGAFAVFSMAWVGLLLLAMSVVAVIATVFGNLALAPLLMSPLVLMIGAMFFTSLYFTFRDSFTVTAQDEALEPSQK